MNNKRYEIGASEQPLDIIKETCGFAGVFKQIGVIGDSLASGEFQSALLEQKTTIIPAAE